ncbi:MAG: flagellar protein FlaG [Actinomycetota bacterium]|nr:flagellar protein FlaG [Actinomycetota bacterium]
MDVGKVGAAYASFFQGTRPAERPREESTSDRAQVSSEETPLAASRAAERGRPGGAEALTQSLLSRLVQRHPREVKLQVHEATNRVIIRITDAQTGETLTEVPRESYLDMVASFLSRLDRLQGEARGVNLDRVF